MTEDLDLEGLERDCLRLAVAVRRRDRARRARERSLNRAPLSDKVSSRGGRVAEGPKPKPRGKSK